MIALSNYLLSGLVQLLYPDESCSPECSHYTKLLFCQINGDLSLSCYVIYTLAQLCVVVSSKYRDGLPACDHAEAVQLILVIINRIISFPSRIYLFPLLVLGLCMDPAGSCMRATGSSQLNKRNWVCILNVKKNVTKMMTQCRDASKPMKRKIIKPRIQTLARLASQCSYYV